MPASKHRRKGKTRPRGKTPRMPPLPAWWFEDEADEAKPAASDLLDWHPRIRRAPDPRQGELPLCKTF
jgi:hypothetical protein